MTIEAVIGLGAMPEKNRNSDVRGKYSKTYFRIEGNGYYANGSMPWPEHIKASFLREVEDIFAAQGWVVTKSERNYVSSTATKGRSSLYLHPQNFRGVCENAEREFLLETLRDAKTFVCGRVDVYAEIHDMTDEQLEELLQSKRNIIESELLEAFTTKRRNLYITDIGFFGVDGKIAKRHSIRRLAIDGEKSHIGQDDRTDVICYTFVSGIFEELVRSKKIVTAQTKNGLGYRTTRKSDLMKYAV